MGVPIFTKVSQIVEGFALWFLNVIIIRVWKWESVVHGPIISMILSDDEGNRIEATIFSNSLAKFKNVLWMEGQSFNLKDATVKLAPSYMSMTSHKYCLHFNSFTSFDKAVYSIRCDHVMVHPSISQIYGNDIYDSSIIYRLMGLECLANGKIARKLVKKFGEAFDKHLFVILRCFSVKKYQGRVWLKSVEGPSDIKYNMYSDAAWYDMLLSYPYPLPEDYSNDHKEGLWVF